MTGSRCPARERAIVLAFWLPVMTPLALSFGQQRPAPTSAPTTAPAVPTGFLYKTAESDGATYPYCVFVPPDYTPDRPWPVILSLHGSGEAGSDGFLQTDVGIGRAIRRNHRLIPAVVVMPQCRPAEAWWNEPTMRLALRCVELTSREYRLDPERVYLTGLSLGGAGTWAIGARLADRFAALVPICGFGDPRDAERLRDIPIWCFHGTADDRVPVQRSREMVEAIRRAGGTVQYTEYENVGHVSWDRAYDTPGLWKWLFEQRRPGGGATHSQPAPLATSPAPGTPSPSAPASQPGSSP